LVSKTDNKTAGIKKEQHYHHTLQQFQLLTISIDKFAGSLITNAFIIQIDD